MSRLRLLLLLALVGGCGGREPAPTVVAYELCRGNVASVDIVPSSTNAVIGVAVQLTPEATRELELFTGQHVGKDLSVGFGDRIFLRAPLGQPIRSGLLINEGFRDGTTARGARDELRASLPEEPCGPDR